jgi:hypothetical protein
MNINCECDTLILNDKSQEVIVLNDNDYLHMSETMCGRHIAVDTSTYLRPSVTVVEFALAVATGFCAFNIVVVFFLSLM